MRAAAGGSVEYSVVATISAPAPAANSIAVTFGARLAMRSGGDGTVRRWPVPSVTTTLAARAGGPEPTMEAAITKASTADAGKRDRLKGHRFVVKVAALRAESSM